MNAVVVKRCSRTRLPRRFLEKWIRALWRELSKHGLPDQARELVLVFVEPKEIKALNRRYRHRNVATDVLSFETTEATSLGELVLCPEILRAQARRTGLSYRHELGYMIIHGCLHLLGYEHEKSVRAEREMFSLQNEIFARLISLDF